mgnify:FL=1|jgi:hypothetical protein
MTDSKVRLSKEIAGAKRAHETAIKNARRILDDYSDVEEIPKCDEFDGPLFWVSYWIRETEKAARDYHVYTKRLSLLK